MLGATGSNRRAPTNDTSPTESSAACGTTNNNASAETFQLPLDKGASDTPPSGFRQRGGAANAFAAEFGAKWPKAVAKVGDDLEQLLTFYDFPAEHWLHLKTTNPIESTFATVRLRTKVTKGPGSRAAGLAMAFKLLEADETRWRAVNAPHLVALVRAGAHFEKGVIVEREPQDQEAAA